MKVLIEAAVCKNVGISGSQDWDRWTGEIFFTSSIESVKQTANSSTGQGLLKLKSRISVENPLKLSELAASPKFGSKIKLNPLDKFTPMTADRQNSRAIGRLDTQERLAWNGTTERMLRPVHW
jgi:hypothetical protein